MNRYPAYKDSGVDWLGQLPEGWAVRPIKAIVETPITDGPHETPTFYDEGVPFVSAEAVSTGKINFSAIRGFISQEDHERYSLKCKPQRHDIFMVKSGATTGVTAIVDTDFEFNIWSPLAVIRCGQLAVPRFVLHYMRSSNFQEAIQLGWSFGTQQNIGMGVIGNLAICLPPLTEQRAIADFLDRETAKIDDLVEEQRRLIALLAEKRQAVISHAVTRGLNPDAPLKPSGIDWLGDIPEGWEVGKLGLWLSSFPCYGVLVPDQQEDGVPMLRISDLTGANFDIGNLVRISPKLSNEYRRTMIAAGDVVLSVVGTIGVSRVVSSDMVGCNLSRAVARIQTSEDLLPEFLTLVFRSAAFSTYVDLTCVGTAQRVLNMGDLSSFRMGLPPLSTQSEIVEKIGTEVGQLDALTDAATSAINLMQERRAALISAAVTGKIDLRDEANFSGTFHEHREDYLSAAAEVE